MAQVRHKCFLSYHKDDQVAVNAFIDKFDDEHNMFITRGIRAPEDLIGSTNTDYVMSEIRRRYLRDSTVTIVLLGNCTWSRRFVDWEIQSSLRGASPNGLLGIILNPGKATARLPERFTPNWEAGYAPFKKYPPSPLMLSSWIEEAFAARARKAHLIVNPRERYSYNRSCS